jgi:hypothetical protein
MKHPTLVVWAVSMVVACFSVSVVAAQAQSTGARKATLAVSPAEPTRQSSAEIGKSRIAAPPTGPRDYDCAGGNCSCAGAKDCVDMKKICAPGTLGCNDYGCTCAEAEEPEGGDG